MRDPDPARELADLVGDRLLPATDWYRRETAAWCGLDPRELACLEFVEILGAAPPTLIAARLGLTRAAASKLLTRLEQKGYIDRDRDRDDGRRLAMTRVPHRALDDSRRGLRTSLRLALTGAGLPPGGTPALTTLLDGVVTVSWCLAREAERLGSVAETTRDHVETDRRHAVERGRRPDRPEPQS